MTTRQAMVRAVLFDVGGPLDTEVRHEQLTDAAIRAALLAEGYAVSDGDYAAACDAAVRSFAPHTYAAIIWTLTGGNRPAAARTLAALRAGSAARAAARGGLEPREGMAELLAWLHGRGVRLGLAANQPQSVIERLDAHGLGRFFQHREVSGTHGYHKPDVRLFLRACTDLETPPEACVMVGDRIDNDIVPARLLGMGTVLFRTGRHIDQQPRSADEVPDVEVRDVTELRQVLAQLLA